MNKYIQFNKNKTLKKLQQQNGIFFQNEIASRPLNSIQRSRSKYTHLFWGKEVYLIHLLYFLCFHRTDFGIVFVVIFFFLIFKILISPEMTSVSFFFIHHHHLNHYDQHTMMIIIYKNLHRAFKKLLSRLSAKKKKKKPNYHKLPMSDFNIMCIVCVMHTPLLYQTYLF